MIAFDTNILLRILLHDNHQEAELSRELILKSESGERFYIAASVLLEIVWTLRIRKISREYIHAALLQVINLPGVVLGQEETIKDALDFYRHGRADFADCLILAESLQNGAQYLASFDVDLCRTHPRCQTPSALLDKL